MTTIDASPLASGWYDAAAVAAPPRPRLTFDIDADIVVIGGGLAGLTIAYEAARRGHDVALIEARRIAWNASGYNDGVVMPGFGTDIKDVIERVGFEDARALWQLAQQGVDYVRNLIVTHDMAGVTPTAGWLQVSRVETGDELVGRLQLLGGDFGADVEGWQTEQVRSHLKSAKYFHAVHFPRSFHIHALNYARGLADLAEKAGVRIFEDTPAIGMDSAGIRKRIVTPSARLRASHIVLAGNVHLGTPSTRLAQTLLPVWNYVAITAPLGDSLATAIDYRGAVSDTDGVDHFRIVHGDRLMWSNPSSTWEVEPRRFTGAIQRRIRAVFPQLGKVEIADIWSGVYGQTVHGMPQIGEWRPGLWIASGFGRQGLNTTAMAGQLISRAIADGDDRWRLLSPYELVWAGGSAGRIVFQAASTWMRRKAAVTAVVSRYRAAARRRGLRRAARLAAANEAAQTASRQQRRDVPASPIKSGGDIARTSREREPVVDDRL